MSCIECTLGHLSTRSQPFHGWGSGLVEGHSPLEGIRESRDGDAVENFRVDILLNPCEGDLASEKLKQRSGVE